MSRRNKGKGTGKNELVREGRGGKGIEIKIKKWRQGGKEGKKQRYIRGRRREIRREEKPYRSKRKRAKEEKCASGKRGQRGRGYNKDNRKEEKIE